jgi:hypothetical protein
MLYNIVWIILFVLKFFEVLIVLVNFFIMLSLKFDIKIKWFRVHSSKEKFIIIREIIFCLIIFKPKLNLILNIFILLIIL